MNAHTPELEPLTGDEVHAHTRLLKLVAGGLVLFGTAQELAGRLGVGVDTYVLTFRALARAGWIFVRPGRAERVFIGWERRSRDLGAPRSVERRRPSITRLP